MELVIVFTGPTRHMKDIIYKAMINDIRSGQDWAPHVSPGGRTYWRRVTNRGGR